MKSKWFYPISLLNCDIFYKSNELFCETCINTMHFTFIKGCMIHTLFYKFYDCYGIYFMHIYNMYIVLQLVDILHRCEPQLIVCTQPVLFCNYIGLLWYFIHIPCTLVNYSFHIHTFIIDILLPYNHHFMKHYSLILFHCQSLETI